MTADLFQAADDWLFKKRQSKRSGKGLHLDKIEFGNRPNNIEKWRDISVGDEVQCVNPLYEHPIYQGCVVEVKAIEHDPEDGVVYFFFWKDKEPYRMRALRFIKRT